MRIKPDFIFETSWETCNKIGGINTVVSSKAATMCSLMGENYVLIGPDVWKGTDENPEFIQDETLFADWVLQMKTHGIKVRCGYWNIDAKPRTILVDFTPFFQQKDKIFAEFWEVYKLDSLYGQWDYIEPAMFGYAAGKVIESFTEYYLNGKKVVAQFHEWMSSAGLLYLKENASHIATSFTTHATVVGRSIAGNNLNLYKKIESYNADETAKTFNVRSKHSLEKISAQNADVFTTVSEITSKECEYLIGKKADIITINGFENQLTSEKKIKEMRPKARKKAIEIASKLRGKEISDDAFLIMTGGRYEFRNKGLDIFVKSLCKLQDSNFKKEIVAFVSVPTHHHEAYGIFANGESKHKFLTHKLHNETDDPLIKLAEECNLNSTANLSLVFVPAYLNGNDRVVNMKYYDFLTAFDLSIFPSYYEPWGYTPLESIAFGIPTITTTYAGFGLWAKKNFENNSSVFVLNRDKKSDEESAEIISKTIIDFIDKDKKTLKKDASDIFKEALWDKLQTNYFDAWDIAFKKVLKRNPELKFIKKTKNLKIEVNMHNNNPEWKKILVQPALPDRLLPLKEMANNLWWSWNYKAEELFSSLKPELWEKSEYNPVYILQNLSMDDIERMLNDVEFLEKLDTIYQEYRNYMEVDPIPNEGKIAYFSMEYGLHTSLKIYSGGLGILAGDYIKQASDSNKDLFAIGLLYRQGYFKQYISHNGEQHSDYSPQKFTQLPILPVRNDDGEWLNVKIALPGRTVFAKVWCVNVGRVKLYLLDTDIKANSPEDQQITYQLYGGDNENRLKQEMILGLGGVRMINELGINPDVYHLNEGHAAFCGLERIKNYIENDAIDFKLACELTRSSSLFTTHTPVPAGHDYFPEELIRAYLPHYSEKLSLNWEDFMALGRFNKYDGNEKFSMSVLATKLSQEVNGVSKIHGRVSREMFAPLFPGYFPDETHIGYVTNGVHYFTWTDTQWQKLYKKYFGKKFLSNQHDAKNWQKIQSVTSKVIWQKRINLKSNLISVLREKLRADLTEKSENPKTIVNILSGLNENALIIGFARRFATYKRAHLLFTNIERLNKIVNNPDRPVVFLFAGKAHPHDEHGQGLIKRIVEISKMPEFIGKIVFVDNYNMTIGKLLTSSVDIWLNTPTRPLEASGTSGEKAVMNGVVNFSVLDGWWAEGYKADAGWAIEEKRTFMNQEFQDEMDAETIYNSLESEITRIYFDRDKDGIPEKWVSYIRNTIANIAPEFTMQRMINDYYEKFYSKLYQRSLMMNKNSFETARELSDWKTKVEQSWQGINVESINIPDIDKGPVEYGTLFDAELIVNSNGLKADELGIEIIFGNREEDGSMKTVQFKQELKSETLEDGKIKYVCEFPLRHAGVYDYSFRIFPKHPNLPHRCDFPLLSWV